MDVSQEQLDSFLVILHQTLSLVKKRNEDDARTQEETELRSLEEDLTQC
jgi:hypothetical protein